MAANAQIMQQDWEQGMQTVATAFDQGVAAAGPQAYCEGLVKLGVPLQACMAAVGQKWFSRVQGKGAAVQAGAQGKGAKFIRRYVARLSGQA